jgi:hypothetical protein
MSLESQIELIRLRECNLQPRLAVNECVIADSNSICTYSLLFQYCKMNGNYYPLFIIHHFASG